MTAFDDARPEVAQRFAEWLEETAGTLDEQWALNLLLNSLYRIDPYAFGIVANEHGFRQGVDP